MRRKVQKSARPVWYIEATLMPGYATRLGIDHLTWGRSERRGNYSSETWFRHEFASEQAAKKALLECDPTWFDVPDITCRICGRSGVEECKGGCLDWFDDGVDAIIFKEGVIVEIGMQRLGCNDEFAVLARWVKHKDGYCVYWEYAFPLGWYIRGNLRHGYLFNSNGKLEAIINNRVAIDLNGDYWPCVEYNA